MRIITLLFTLAATTVFADLTELVPEQTLAVIAHEVSGVSAKRNLDRVTLYHRTRAGSQFRAAAEHIRTELAGYGFKDAQILTYPADGRTLFGTQKSRLAWEVEFAELWELDSDGQRVKRHADWAAMPLSLAQDSVSGKVTASLVDIGAGMSDSDYAGKNLAGRLVLTSSQPGAVVERAVGELGAAGIISYAPNQKSAWWKEDDRLVRWGHMESFAETRSFGFMVSLGTARRLEARLAAGETIVFEAEVRASQSVGEYALVTATIPGADPVVGGEEIVYSCHLDHPRPGANDNASGCVSILETARTLHELVALGTLPPPRRTLRFTWPAEIEGSIIYLAELGDTSHIRANIHLDMVGGGPETRSVFRVSGGPMSLPSFQADVAHEIGAWVNDQTLRFASGEDVAYPLVSPEGGKLPQLAVMEGISLGSDHQVYNESSWAIPGIYLHDWPDRYIHTNFDTAAMIDPTKLKRAAFIAAVQGWYLANFDQEDVGAALRLLRANALNRARDRQLTMHSVPAADHLGVLAAHWAAEQARMESINDFASPGQHLVSEREFLAGLAQLTGPISVPSVAPERDERVFTRNLDIKGPMHAFGYSYIEDKLGQEAYAALTLGGAQAYEALNLVDGERSVSDIRDWLLAEFAATQGVVALADVAAYLEALASIGVLEAP
jgi:hypothetical protein